MPEAKTTHTRTPPDIVAAILHLVTASGDGELTVTLSHAPAERDLLVACEAVAVGSQAMRLLTHAVAEMSPEDPRHEASYGVVEQLRPNWVSQVARVSVIPAQGARGITAKATLIASLVEDDQADRVDGPPAMRIALSLASDLLGLGRG